ncbi:MAG: hypothetical protein RLZZ124_481 [Cyanobacteriota bacterium]|jgi:hypothetical protein
MPADRCRQPLRNASVRLRLRTQPRALNRRLEVPAARRRSMAMWSRLNAATEAQFARVLPPQLTAGATAGDVLCVVPYLANHIHLHEALRSIAEQTTKPGRVVVAIDNAAADHAWSEVESACRNLADADIGCEIQAFSGINGPYRMLNQIIAANGDVSHIWLHDSDDISHHSRLSKQLAFMERHALDICSCFELRIRASAVELVDYPLHVSRALNHEPGHCMLWPASLIRRQLWEDLNGCSDHHRFGADTEFQLRACFIARMANYPAYLYARRIRETSLTGSPETGLRSWQRGYITSLYKADYYRRQMMKQDGQPIELQPRFKT